MPRDALVPRRKEAALQNVLSPQQFQQYLTAREEIKQKAEQKLLEKRNPDGS